MEFRRKKAKKSSIVWKECKNSNANNNSGPIGDPKRVVITGAAGGVGTLLAMMIGRGELFGPNTLVDLMLVEMKGNMSILKSGTVAELDICNLPFIHKIKTTNNREDAFRDAEYILLAGGFPVNPAFSRDDVVSGNAMEYKNVGIALQAVKNENVKILLISDPQNINMIVLCHFAPYLKPQQLTGLSRVDHNRTVAKMAKILHISPAKVTCASIFGNIGANVFPDLRHAKAEVLGKVMDAYEAVGDDYYLKFDFVRDLHNRGDEVFERLNRPPSLTTANAAIQHMKSWIMGTPPNDWTSMVVISDGSYEIEKGLPYSFPVRVNCEGKWFIVDDLDMDFFEKERLEATHEDIRRERDFVLAILGLTTVAQANEDGVPLSWSFGNAQAIPCRVLGPLERQRMTYF